MNVLLNAPLRISSEALIRTALAEDLGHGGDLTTDSIVAPERRTTATIGARAHGTIAGLDVALLALEMLAPGDMRSTIRIADGQRCEPGAIVAELEGPARALLTGERTMLNFLNRLSGIATATHTLVEAVKGTRAQIIDTRKTTPGLRVLEKYAVRCGGGANHRFGLDDAVLIKDNHLALAGSVHDAVAAVRANVGHMVKIQIEVDTLAQLSEALEEPIDAVLLDNMSPDQLAEAVRLVEGRVLTEASGGVRLETIRAIAESGVDMISLGSLTNSAPTLDLGLDIQL